MNEKYKIILTGAPGTGKTSLIQNLAKKGFNTISEPAREIILKQRNSNGIATWDQDREQFLALLLDSSVEKYKCINSEELTFFDRGILDSVAYYNLAKMDAIKCFNLGEEFRYNPLVFVTPPWEEIYENDEERTMRFEEIIPFHQCLMDTYKRSNYQVLELPFVSIEERTEFILNKLETEFCTKVYLDT